MKQMLFIITLLSLLSCENQLHIDEIDRSKFCNYFSLTTGSYSINGIRHKTISTEINKVPEDKVSLFIQKHSQRYDYLITKTFSSVGKANRETFDSTILNNKFCTAITSDTFYNYFTLLACGAGEKGNKKLTFTVPESMRIASRFFMCDNVREKDTTIGYHICVGLNGILELKLAKDFTVLEAFCFEAIFVNIKKNAALINNFNNYIAKAVQHNKMHFLDFRSYLATIKNECYACMEKDKDLETVLINYYNQNTDNINFKIK